jgi:hypothetical protein
METTNSGGFFDGPRVPSLASYCASPTCGTGSPCDACRIDDGLSCDLCGSPATVIDRHGGQVLPLCSGCQAQCEAEVAAGKGGV